MLFCTSPVFKRIAAGLLGALIAIVPAFPAWSARLGIIESGRLNVRSGPALTYRAIAVLEKGTTVNVVSVENAWAKIEWNGNTGYVKVRPQYIRIVGTPKSDQNRGKENRSSTIKAAEKDAETVREKIREGKDRIQRFSKKESAIVESLNDIDRELNAARHQVKALQKALAESKQSMDRVRGQIDTLVENIRVSEGYAEKRLVALYKLNWLGRVHVLASAESIYELLRRESLLERVLEVDQTLLESLNQRRDGLRKLMAEHQRQLDQKRLLEEQLNAGIASMSEKKAEKEQLLEKIRGQKSLQLASLAALKTFASELDSMMEELRRQPVVEQPQTALPTKPFPQLKGLLKMPVKGKIISRFGKFLNKQFNIMNFNSGIDIQADRGDPVRSIYAGKILFSGWLKGYGNMLIVDHGSNYYSVYANNEDLFKEKGQMVETGEVIATVGDTGSRMGPKLYFELRHGGKPMDPLDWIDNG